MGITTAPCKFCGQLVQIQDMPTEEGAAEAATMACECQEAVSYRREKKEAGEDPGQCTGTIWERRGQ